MVGQMFRTVRLVVYERELICVWFINTVLKWPKGAEEGSLFLDGFLVCAYKFLHARGDHPSIGTDSEK